MANTKYINWYTRENYDRLSVFLPKGSRERIKTAAAENGQSINEFIRHLIPKELIAQREYKGRVENNDDYSGHDDSRDTAQT